MYAEWRTMAYQILLCTETSTLPIGMKMLWWPIYMIVISSSFLNINPIYSRRDFLLALDWVPPRSAVFVGTRIWSGVSWLCWQSVKAVWDKFRLAGIHVRCVKTSILEPQEAIQQTLTLLRGARLIAWSLRGMLTGYEAFLMLLGVSGLRPPKTRPCATLIQLVGRTTNTDFLPIEWSVCTTLWEALGWDTLRSDVLVGTRI